MRDELILILLLGCVVLYCLLMIAIDRNVVLLQLQNENIRLRIALNESRKCDY